MKRWLSLAAAGLLASGVWSGTGLIPTAQAYSNEWPVKIVSSPSGVTLVKSNEGRAWSWGNPGLTGRGSVYDGQLPYNVQFYRQPEDLYSSYVRVADIGAGAEHLAVLSEDGEVWTWGENYYGALGNGSTEAQYKPHPVLDPEEDHTAFSKLKALAVGDYHNLALKDDGTVWAWGSNDFGQLGDGTNEQRNAPVQVPNLTNVKSIQAGRSFSVALTNDGTVYTWGHNDSGKLGIGNNTYDFSTSVPQRVAGPDVTNHPYKVVQIYMSSTSDSAFFFTEDGRLYAWGDNSYGQLGFGDLLPVYEPKEVEALRGTGLKQVALGSQHTLVLTGDYRVYGMGADTSGQLLRYNRLSPSPSPSPSPGLSSYPSNIVMEPQELSPDLNGVLTIGAGANSSFVIQEAGTILAFGSNRMGELGIPSLPIEDQNEDGFHDLTGLPIVDEDEDGYLDEVQQLIVPYESHRLEFHGHSVSGTVMLMNMDMPISYVELELYSPEYGSLFTTTSEYGHYTFFDVLPGTHYIRISSRYSNYFYMDYDNAVDVYEGIESHPVEVSPRWIPEYMSFHDLNPREGVLSGNVFWSSPSYPLNQAIYKVYFMDEEGYPLTLAGSSEEGALELTLDEVTIPEGAVGLKLFVESADPTSLVCPNTECETGVWVELYDYVDIQAVVNLQFMDLDFGKGYLKGPIRWDSNPDLPPGVEYQLQWMTEFGDPIGESLHEGRLSGTTQKFILPTGTEIPDGAYLLAIEAYVGESKVGASYLLLKQVDANYYDAHLKVEQLKQYYQVTRWDVEVVYQIMRRIMTTDGRQLHDLTGDGVFDRYDIEMMLDLVEVYPDIQELPEIPDLPPIILL